MTTWTLTPALPSARRQFAATILGLEAFVAFFAGLTVFGLDRSGGEFVVALVIGGLCLIAAGLLRFRWIIALGWVLQAILIAGGCSCQRCMRWGPSLPPCG